MSKIKVGIVGVGSCAKSLVEGIQYYNENPEDKIGLMYEDIGGYKVHDIEFVLGFDIDKRKVNKKLAEALRAKPNCAMDHVDQIYTNGESNVSCIADGASVYSAPELDGIAPHMHEYPDEVTFVNGAQPAESFDRTVELLKYHNVDVLVNYLPVGSEEASKYWVDVALAAEVHFVNCIPTLISTEDAVHTEQRFIDK
ncbi:MAG: Myo-inositol-1-phosphate synthase, partial [Saprospiraceae bacterium]|nr:Myo-inositol-1-phosphate synthase [Saprospiraceae bacterium]